MIMHNLLCSCSSEASLTLRLLWLLVVGRVQVSKVHINCDFDECSNLLVRNHGVDRTLALSSLQRFARVVLYDEWIQSFLLVKKLFLQFLN